MHVLSRLAATGAVLLSLSACADDTPPGVVAVPTAVTEDPAVAAPDLSRLVEADAPADAAASVAPDETTAPLPAPAAPAPAEAPRLSAPDEAPRRATQAAARVQTVTVTAAAFPSLGTGPVDLPLGEPVTADVPASAAGEIASACGMDMLRGTLVVGS